MAGTVVASTINNDTGLFSTNNAYLGIAKAWVNFVGSSGTINQSFNVSSVTRVSTGVYTINFTTAMPNANYSVYVSASPYAATSPMFLNAFANASGYVAPTTTAISVTSQTYNASSFVDPSVYTVGVIGS
jgi:hypothetical protein